ncbi:polysaccharide deacetylase family protein [Dyadobacter arcticus]|uniref:Peptidoglycan/xylan/chitin deacetylase (PgdA/CDA1 family) n=1 Tax=Dyadobacter arcticus TaxID=1078754 RepID=A0ABX0UHN8_9BACT|nr:polysaccharide deacetylase family protein [Dyadobacter arcticus]NIJ51075.1 peptidoglycan/xylan/chitin deacetylase (PgdA/CDA1 family) [Dyadobacter arcticus]
MKYTLSRLIRLFHIILAALSFGAVLIACQPDTKIANKSGVAISFDDHFINEWYALRPLFQKYNAKVTFFITCPDSLSTDEITKLKQLEKDGHEIGFHSTTHGKSTELIAAVGPAKYADLELKPGLKHMAAAGFSPTSYAHPGGNHNDKVDSVLTAYGFKILRDVAVSRRKLLGLQVYALAPRLMSWIYYKFDHQTSVDALLIDTDSGVTEVGMKEAIQKAKASNIALMLFGHEPLYNDPKNGEYGFSVALLEKILREAHAQKLKFYTMSELPSQIDH